MGGKDASEGNRGGNTAAQQQNRTEGSHPAPPDQCVTAPTARHAQ